MAINPAGDGREICSAHLVHEMLVETVGSGEPATDEGMAAAGLGVGTRLERARRAIEDPDSRGHGRDTKAMAAVLLIDEEAGVFDGRQA